MSRDGRISDSRSETARPGAAAKGALVLRRAGLPLIVAIVVVLLATALILFAGDSSEPATVDASGPEPGMGLRFFPNTQGSGTPCTGKCVGLDGQTFSIDVVTNPAPPGSFSAYRINITY